MHWPLLFSSNMSCHWAGNASMMTKPSNTSSRSGMMLRLVMKKWKNLNKRWKTGGFTIRTFPLEMWWTMTTLKAPLVMQNPKKNGGVSCCWGGRVPYRIHRGLQKIMSCEKSSPEDHTGTVGKGQCQGARESLSLTISFSIWFQFLLGCQIHRLIMPTVGYFCNPFVVLNKERLGEPREECKLLGAASPLCCEKSAFITWCPSPCIACRPAQASWAACTRSLDQWRLARMAGSILCCIWLILEIWFTSIWAIHPWTNQCIILGRKPMQHAVKRSG